MASDAARRLLTTPEARTRMADVFHRFARRTSELVGRPWAFALAATVILAWGLTGPLFGFSDTWQLVVNTGTTIVTCRTTMRSPST